MGQIKEHYHDKLEQMAREGETRYIPITGCHDCDIKYESENTGEQSCYEAGDVREHCKSKTFHPDCPLPKSIVKELDWKFGYWDEFRENNLKNYGRHELGSAYLEELSIKYSMAETDKGKIISLIEKGEAGNEYVKDDCKDIKEAKAKAQEHFNNMIKSCLI